MKIINTILFAALTTFPLITNAASVNYTEIGNDGVGNSFKFDFSWDTATNSVTSIQSYIEYDNYGNAPSVDLVAPSFTWNPNLFLSPIPTVGAVIFEDSSGLIAFFMLTGNNNLPNVTNLPSYNYAFNDQYTGHQWFGYQSTISQVPEPTSIALLVFGILGFVASRRKVTHAQFRQ